ncbi:hypothetical protein KI809_12715 [Geobacter pelophilus]|uniref:Uncharacterized protein n=1 Tax=Geoanaerobacter pelophilus TaxID=60036 RepID=A0AAW4L2E6_9BACT|nr:hypothetical protein [Geoanaerobacter pelophilus]
MLKDGVDIGHFIGKNRQKAINNSLSGMLLFVDYDYWKQLFVSASAMCG